MCDVKDLIAGHHRHQVFGITEIDDVMGPAGDHIDGFDLVAADLKLHGFSGVDVPLLDQSVAMDHNELFPFGIVPVLSLGDTGF